MSRKYRIPRLQWHCLLWHPVYSDTFGMSQMIGLLLNFLWLQWQSGYSDTFPMSRGCHYKRGPLYIQLSNIPTFNIKCSLRICDVSCPGGDAGTWCHRQDSRDSTSRLLLQQKRNSRDRTTIRLNDLTLMAGLWKVSDFSFGRFF